MNTRLIEIAEREWTMNALHDACSAARINGDKIILLRMMHVNNPGFLGSEYAYLAPDRQEMGDIHAYETLIEDYGVQATLSNIQYITRVECLIEIATAKQASVLYAKPAASWLGWWTRWQQRRLNNGLISAGITLVTLQAPLKIVRPLSESMAVNA